jgi:hypothetical protein
MIERTLFYFRMFSNLMNRASQFAMEGVKNLVVKQYVNKYFHVHRFIISLNLEITGNKNS